MWKFVFILCRVGTTLVIAYFFASVTDCFFVLCEEEVENFVVILSTLA